MTRSSLKKGHMQVENQDLILICYYNFLVVIDYSRIKRKVVKVALYIKMMFLFA